MYALLAKKVSPPEWRALWSRMRTAETSPHSPLHPLPQHTLAHILLRGNYSILFTAGSEVPAGLASPCS